MASSHASHTAGVRPLGEIAALGACDFLLGERVIFLPAL